MQLSKSNFGLICTCYHKNRPEYFGTPGRRRRMRLSFITNFAGRTLPATGRRLRLRSREGQLCGDEAAAGVSRCERERVVQRLQKGSQVPGHDAGPGDCGSEALHLWQDAVCVLLRVAAATTLGDGCTWEVRRAAEGATGGVHNPPSAYGGLRRLPARPKPAIAGLQLNLKTA